MSPLYTYLGKLLVSGGKLATNPNCCCEYPPPTDCDICEQNSITISLAIDGSDVFILQGCFLTSEHLTFMEPGSFNMPDCNNNQATVDGVVWPFLIKNNPFDLRQINKKFGKASNITVNKIAGRGIVNVTQQPGPDNNWTGKVIIDDDGPSGPDCYTIEISWTC